MPCPKLSPGLWAGVLLGAGVVVLNLGMMRGDLSVETYFDLKKSRDILKETVEGLEAENESLSYEIMRLRKSPSYAKKVLRDRYHLTEPNEDIVFFAE
jgi:cell division protein FtsB